jgi:hypothetical protein
MEGYYNNLSQRNTYGAGEIHLKTGMNDGLSWV